MEKNRTMKINEAPEKIYVEIKHPFSEEYTEMIAFEDGDGIEYTRTDAFIDKACEWLKNNIHDYYTINEFVQWFNEMFDDFKKAMKGE